MNKTTSIYTEDKQHKDNVFLCSGVRLYIVRVFFFYIVVFFKQKTSYEMRISDWSADVCSSDLSHRLHGVGADPRVHRWHLVCRAQWRCGMSMRTPVGRARGLGSAKDGVAHWTAQRSEERRVGKECVSTCRSRWSQYY